MSSTFFEIIARAGRARRGIVRTTHGTFETPAFMPVGTAATVKGMDPRDLVEAGAEVVLANTYHLTLRPGSDTIARLGGVHDFMGWPHPILTDSGGYQVMSLAAMRKITDDGIAFRSHLDGSPMMLTPENVIAAQVDLGSDIAMPLDVCPRHDEGEAGARRAVDLTSAWARRTASLLPRCGQAVFGIIQGGGVMAAREESLSATLPLPFDGFAVGSIQVGEPKELSYEVVDRVVSGLPEGKPRYVMGVGTPEDIVTMVKLGVDMFDTVLPTRNARNGMLFTSEGKLVIKNAVHARDERPADPRCDCPTCRRFSRAYLRHLYMAGEALSVALLTRHNLQFYLDLMRAIRHAIASDSLERFGNVSPHPTAS